MKMPSFPKQHWFSHLQTALLQITFSWFAEVVRTRTVSWGGGRSVGKYGENKNIAIMRFFRPTTCGPLSHASLADTLLPSSCSQGSTTTRLRLFEQLAGGALNSRLYLAFPESHASKYKSSLPPHFQTCVWHYLQQLHDGCNDLLI